MARSAVHGSGFTRNVLQLALASLAALCFVLPALAQVPSPRVQTNLDRGWKFYLGDQPAASQPSFDDAAWSAINLPHSFSIPYFRSAQFYVGYGWYRRHLQVESAAAERQYFLEFEGVFQEAEVFVNGARVGQHEGGYTGFSLNITQALHAGDNVIAVRVNNLWNPQLNPRAGEHVFSGGIYRNVSLVAVDAVHIPWYGTFVTTPEVSSSAAAVQIETEVQNSGAKPVSVQVETEILAPDGRSVARFSAERSVAAGGTETVAQSSPRLPNPQLWSPNHPALYTAVSRLRVGGKLADIYRTPFGIRSIRWTADKGFFLNGEHLYFHGADVHQDHAGWGDAVTNAGAARDVQMVKDAGFDFIRGSHYPHSPAFADACDRKGVLFWSENSFWGTGGPETEGGWTASAYPVRAEDQKPFEESVKRSLAEMIRIHRNHPSIVAWSMTNEVFFSDPAVQPRMREFLQSLVQYSRQLDPTRPAALGGVQRGNLDHIGEIAGYNGDGARLFIDPGVPNAVTEYGSAVEPRPGSYNAHWDQLQQTEFPWRSGQAIWCAFDHGSIFGEMGMMGIVDYFRIPKRAWYWYRNAYRQIPPPAWPKPGEARGLRLATVGGATIQPADGTADVQVLVTVVDGKQAQISNSPDVTLTIESGPGEFPTGRSITFRHNTDIDIRDGQAAIEFRSYYSGKTVVRASSPGLPDARIVLESRDAPAFAAGKTPLFLPAAYVRFSTAREADETQELAQDRPTRSSSDAAGHGGQLANDGDLDTYWAVGKAGETAWWGVDLERACALKSASFTLPFSGKVKAAVQVSSDLDAWKTVAELDDAVNAGERTSLELPPGTAGRGIRLVFAEIPAGATAAISEFTVTGMPQRSGGQ